MPASLACSTEASMSAAPAAHVTSRGSDQRVDTEPSRPVRRWLIGIGPDNLEIGASTQRHERIPRAPARMLAAGRRLHAKQPGNVRHAGRQIGSRVNEMVDGHWLFRTTQVVMQRAS